MYNIVNWMPHNERGKTSNSDYLSIIKFRMWRGVENERYVAKKTLMKEESTSPASVVRLSTSLSSVPHLILRSLSVSHCKCDTSSSLRSYKTWICEVMSLSDVAPEVIPIVHTCFTFWNFYRSYKTRLILNMLRWLIVIYYNLLNYYFSGTV